ncbi:MAG: hypothetical protein F2832_04565 [Actinobacteria bacterium]|nr:hypothetical protein [Actinomycetota bacterium]
MRSIPSTAARAAAIVTAALAACAVSAGAQAPSGAFRQGVGVDGPSANVGVLGGLDLARDGDGLVAWVRTEGGEDHASVALLRAGASRGVFRIDAGQPALTAGPVVAAGNGGRMVVAWANALGVFAALRPAEGAVFGAPQRVGAPGAGAPAIDLSPAGVGYLVWAQGGDVRGAYLPRTGTAFSVYPAPLDADPAREAGAAALRPRVATSADGIGLAVWGEALDGGMTRVVARRLVRGAPSARVVDATAATVQGRTAGAAELPEVAIEDDSSYACVGMRQQVQRVAGPDSVPRALLRHLRGSAFEAPVAVDGDPDAGATGGLRLALNGRGQGLVTAEGAVGAVLASIIRDDVPGAAVTIGAAGGAGALPAGGFAENYDGVTAWFTTPSPGLQSEVQARLLQDDPALAQAPPFGAPALLSGRAGAFDDPLAGISLGTPDPLGGLEVRTDRTGDAVVAFVQESAAGRTLMLATYDRAPGVPAGTTTTFWRPRRRPLLTWQPSTELWGAVTYTVLIDGVPAATTTGTSVAPSVALADGLHRWQVVATDIRGQATRSATRNLRIDATPPQLTVRVSRRLAETVLRLRALDRGGSKITTMRVDFGDGSPPLVVEGGRATVRHVFGPGRHRLRVSARDGAGNATVVSRTLRTPTGATIR